MRQGLGASPERRGSGEGLEDGDQRFGDHRLDGDVLNPVAGRALVVRFVVAARTRVAEPDGVERLLLVVREELLLPPA